jgi:carbon storage regulator CsrA
MLVLSRRVDEELVFPNLDIRIKILRNLGNRIQLGIDAPEFIEVARGERVESWNANSTPIGVSRHEVRNRVNAVRLALELYDRQMNRGDIDAANRTFLRIVGQLRQADLELAGLLSPPVEEKKTGPKVLVVDDDANERQLLAGLLQMDGCRVETAIDGLDAIAFLKHGAVPDVVLLDMQMPRLGGKETLAAIRNNWRDLLVFGVSGTTPAENDIALGGPCGIDEWFEKPLNPSHLVDRMRQRLRNLVTVSA